MRLTKRNCIGLGRGEFNSDRGASEKGRGSWVSGLSLATQLLLNEWTYFSIVCELLPLTPSNQIKNLENFGARQDLKIVELIAEGVEAHTLSLPLAALMKSLGVVFYLHL